MFDEQQTSELRMAWAVRPREGSARECQAWTNGFLEALDAVGARRDDLAAILGAETLRRGRTEDGTVITITAGVER